jgi:hypothetical protein
VRSKNPGAAWGLLLVHAMLVDGQVIVTDAVSIRGGKTLTLIKDPRGADPGGAPAYHLPVWRVYRQHGSIAAEQR